MAAGDTVITPDARTEFADTDCRFCTHSGDAHDAGECWVEKDGAQCQCWWYTPLSEVGNTAINVTPYLHTTPPKESA
jgi:hypothetical protein